MSKCLPTGDLRLVLAWGQYPKDMDIEVYTPENCDSRSNSKGSKDYSRTKHRMYYKEKTCPTGGGGKVHLDRDDTDGFGPETVTFNAANKMSGLADVVVTRYSDDASLPGSKPLATIEVLSAITSPNELYVFNISEHGRINTNDYSQPTWEAFHLAKTGKPSPYGPNSRMPAPQLLTCHGRAPAAAKPVDNYEPNSVDGGWGGSCTCPNGEVYQVADQGRGCSALNCHGGTSGACHKYDGAWSKAKVTCGDASSPRAPNSNGPKDTMYVDQTMSNNNELKSSNGHRAVMQTDGDFVVYNNGGHAIWNTHTAGKYNARLVFQNDGNLVMYQGHNVLWATHTVGKAASRLVMQNDGNLVMYKGGQAVWSSKHGRA